jgi:hypothetical protein
MPTPPNAVVTAKVPRLSAMDTRQQVSLLVGVFCAGIIVGHLLTRGVKPPQGPTAPPMPCRDCLERQMSERAQTETPDPQATRLAMAWADQSGGPPAEPAPPVSGIMDPPPVTDVP